MAYHFYSRENSDYPSLRSLRDCRQAWKHFFLIDPFWHNPEREVSIRKCLMGVTGSLGVNFMKKYLMMTS